MVEVGGENGAARVWMAVFFGVVEVSGWRRRSATVSEAEGCLKEVNGGV